MIKSNRLDALQDRNQQNDIKFAKILLFIFISVIRDKYYIIILVRVRKNG